MIKQNLNESQDLQIGLGHLGPPEVKLPDELSAEELQIDEQ